MWLKTVYMKKILSSLFVMGLILTAMPVSAQEGNSNSNSSVEVKKNETKKGEIKNILKENKEEKKNTEKNRPLALPVFFGAFWLVYRTFDDL